MLWDANLHPPTRELGPFLLTLHTEARPAYMQVRTPSADPVDQACMHGAGAGAIMQVRTPRCMLRLAHHASADAMHGADAMVHACMVQVRTPHAKIGDPVILIACTPPNTFSSQTRKTEVESRHKQIISQLYIGKTV